MSHGSHSHPIMSAIEPSGHSIREKAKPIRCVYVGKLCQTPGIALKMSAADFVNVKRQVYDAYLFASLFNPEIKYSVVICLQCSLLKYY